MANLMIPLLLLCAACAGSALAREQQHHAAPQRRLHGPTPGTAARQLQRRLAADPQQPAEPPAGGPGRPRERALARQDAMLRRHAEMAARWHQSRRNSAFVGYQEHAGDPQLLVMSTRHGEIRIRLRADVSPVTVAKISNLAREAKEKAGEIFRHEPVTENWGAPAFGPPYALISGAFETDDANWPLEGNPVISKGDVGMVPGSTTFVICLADHPEWGKSHTVWGTVDADDADSWAALSRIPREPFFNRTSDGITTRWLEPAVVAPLTLRLEQEPAAAAAVAAAAASR